MKVLIVYSSRETGNSRKIAETLVAADPSESVLAPAAEAPSPEGFDAVVLCFGIYRGWPDGDMIAWMKRCRGKEIALFVTLGAWPDSEHAFRCLGRAEGLLESCEVTCRFLCQGRYTEAYLEHLKSIPPSEPHGWTPEKEKRVLEAMKHPSETDCAEAAAAFRAWLEQRGRGGEKAEEPVRKKAVVLSVFGTTVPEAEKAYEILEESIRRRVDLPVFRAYTSPRVRRRLNGRVPSLTGVLKRLVEEGYTDVEVVAGYLADGEEYGKVLRDLAAFRRVLNVHVNGPPLSTLASLSKFLPCLWEVLPEERRPGEPVIFAGHGHADGRSDFAYMALNSELKKLDPDFHAACVEGKPDLESLLPHLRGKRVWILPFLMVAGEHVRTDLAGEGRESWRSRLSEHGFEVRTRIRGLGEFPAVADSFTEGVQ